MRLWEALKVAEQPHVHTFIATTPIHMQYKLKKTPDQVIEQAVEAVKYAQKNSSHSLNGQQKMVSVQIKNF